MNDRKWLSDTPMGEEIAQELYKRLQHVPYYDIDDVLHALKELEQDNLKWRATIMKLDMNDVYWLLRRTVEHHNWLWR